MEQCHRTSSRRNAACRAHLSSISLRSPNRPGTQTPRRSNFSTRRFSNDRVHRVYLDRAAAPNGILCHARHFSLSLCLSLRGYLNSWPKISSPSMISFNSFRFPRRDRRERKASRKDTATRTIRNDTNRGKVFIISTFDASVYIPYSQIRFVRMEGAAAKRKWKSDLS